MEIYLLAAITFPFYAIAYGVSHLLNLKGKEDMPTLREWLSLDF